MQAGLTGHVYPCQTLGEMNQIDGTMDISQSHACMSLLIYKRDFLLPPALLDAETTVVPSLVHLLACST